MLREKTGLGAGLFFAVLLSSLLGMGNQQLPYLAAKYGSHSGYLGLIGAYILSILVIWAGIKLNNRNPGKTLIEYAPLVLGKVLGKLCGFLFLSFIFLLLVWAIRSTAESINLFFLQRTPLWITMILFLLAVTYLAFQGIESICKTCAFILPLALFFTVLTMFLSFQKFNYHKISPVFYLNKGTLLSAVHLFYAFFPLALIFIFLPYLTETRKGFPVIFKATGISGLIFFMFIVASIGMYGAQGVVRYGWPIAELSRTIKVPYLLESFGLFYVVTWLSQMYIAAGACYFAAAQGFSQLFSCLHYKWFILILSPLIIFSVLIVNGVVEVRLFFDYFRIIGFIILVFLPLLLWAVDKLKKSREEANNA